MGVKGKRWDANRNSTSRSLYEIEVALAKSHLFDFTRNIVAYNIKGWGKILPIGHECDMLVLSRAGFLSEIEIKRSYSDFVADFNKKHQHQSQKEELIKYFYYCVPSCIKDKCIAKLNEVGQYYTGIVTYDEHLKIIRYWSQYKPRKTKALSLEQQLEVARLGAMRVVGLKSKLITKQNNKYEQD